MNHKLNLLCLLLFVCFGLTACTDSEDDLLPAENHFFEGNNKPLSYENVSSSAGLVKQSDGTFHACKRVPLVGRGRIVDGYSNGTIDVLSGNNGIGNITDLNLDNFAEFGSGLASIDLAQRPIFSVRDLHHTYQAGEKVGIVFKAKNSGLLTVDLLKGFYIKTAYTDIDGEETTDGDKFLGQSNNTLLGLNLINVGGDNGFKEISFTTTKNFNEVQFGITGVDISALSKAGIQIYYAFVGENERQPALNGSVHFPNASLYGGLNWTRMPGSENIVDGNMNNSAAFELVTGLLGQPCATVDFGRDVPAGWEVGYEISNSNLLTLGTGAKLETYDENNKKIDGITEANLLSLNLQAGSHRQISLITTQPCRRLYIYFPTIVKLGVTNVYYAYARPKVDIDPSSIFSMPSVVSIDANFFELPTPEGGKTEWRIQGTPEGASPIIKTDANTQKTRIRRMTVNGDYELLGTFTPNADPNSGFQPNPIQVSTIIRRDRQEPSASLITRKEADFTTEQNGIYSGGLLPITVLTNQDNILDNNYNSYASTGGVNVATNEIVVNIKLHNPISPQNYGGKARVGFIVRSSFEFLSLKALNNSLRVVLFRNGKNIQDTGGIGLKGLKVGLLGGQGDRSKIFAETDQAFDQIMLMHSGLAGVDLSKTRIYGAFCESASDKLIGIEEVGIHILNTMQHNATFNYNRTYIGGLAVIGGAFIDLGKAIDRNSHSLSSQLEVANVAGGTSVSVKFNDVYPSVVSGKHRVGVVCKDNTGLDVELLKGTSFVAYYKGEEVGKTTIKGGVLDLDLSAKSDRIYTELEVTRPVDELRITGGGVASIAATSIYGFYVRPDEDGDGFSDDTEENEPSKEDVLPLIIKVQSEDICENEYATLQVSRPVKPVEPQPGNKSRSKADNKEKLYTAELYNQKTNMTRYIKDLVMDNQNQTVSFRIETAGIYIIRLKEADNDETYSNPITLTAHPLRTKWTGEYNTDWNNWNNWENGSPWHCTDVIIPACDRYPELSKNGKFYCHNLHMYAKANLVGSQYLQYGGRVWIDMPFTAGMPFLITAPLKNMFTGDMFIPAGKQGNHARGGDMELFKTLTPSNTPENRFSPLIHQYFWSSDVTGKIVSENGLNDQPIICSETDWTASFNAVAEPYSPGVGFKMYADKQSLSSYDLVFRFPKMHNEYTYFDATGQSTGYTERVNRIKSLSGHFIFEPDHAGFRPGQHVQDTYTVTLRNKTAKGNIFVTGNPYVAYIDVRKFMEANKNIAALHIYGLDGSTTVKRVGSDLIYSQPGLSLIYPMQGFYVELAEGQNRQETQIHFNASMQCQSSMTDRAVTQRYDYRSMRSRHHSTGDALYIEASVGRQKRSCMINYKATANDAYHANEDARLLYDNSPGENLAVFTIADHTALSIQQCSGRTSIPLGLRLNGPSTVSVAFHHAPGKYWSHWAIEDRQTGKRYALKSSDVYLELDVNGTSLNRYHLIRL